MAQDPTPPLTPERLHALASIPFDACPSPAFVVHAGCLEANCRELAAVREATGARVLLALKGFACHATFGRIARHLDGTACSGLHEALLAREFFPGEAHVYSPAFREEELRRLGGFAHTLVFNSVAQAAQGLRVLPARGRPAFGLRVNPEYSEVETELYDPCAAGSRLGLTRDALDRERRRAPRDPVDALEGLHFHTLCEQDSDALEHTVAAFEERFGDLLAGRRWLNLGGGHHITRPDYDRERLIRVLRDLRERRGLDLYLEPGEAVALHAGVLVATVLDVLETPERDAAILDISATCHMPDVLEMPYRPEVLGAGAPGEFGHDYRLGGLSCLAGDIVGDYSFPAPLRPGHRIVFLDMAHYTMVKTTTFNGVPLPDICVYEPEAERLRAVRRFGYEAYRDRLG